MSKNFRKQVENIQKQRMSKGKLVSLENFRTLKTPQKDKSVLIVDDDEVMRQALKRVLEQSAFEVTLAEDGISFAKALEKGMFDVILLDINLPWLDGIELTQLLKQHATLRQIPIIHISGRKDSESVAAAAKAGGDAFIPKPFDIKSLLQVIEEKISPPPKKIV